MKNNKEDGSAVIEATICLSVFIFFMMFFIMIVQLTMTQSIMQNALDQTAKELSQDLYLYDALGVINFRHSVSEADEEAGNVVDNIADTGNEISGELSSNDDMAVKVKSVLKSITSLFSDSDDPDEIKDDFLEQFSIENIKAGGKTAVNAVFDNLISAGENALIPVLFRKYVSTDGKAGTADGYLKRLHVVGGIKGLDFGKSSMFGTWKLEKTGGGGSTPAPSGTPGGTPAPSSDVTEDMDKEVESGEKGDKNTINLILEYKVKVLHPIQGWKEVKCIQSAATRAWIGAE